MVEREGATYGRDVNKLLGGLNAEHAYVEVKGLVDRFPEVNYEEVEDDLEVLLRSKYKTSEDSYISNLAHTFYGTLHLYIDNKWLALSGTEEEILNKFMDVLHVLIEADTDVLPREFLDSVIIGNELLDMLHNTGLTQQQIQALLFTARSKHAKIGIDKINNHNRVHQLDFSPDEWAELIVSNTNEVREGDKVRLQLKPSQYREVINILGLAKGVNDVTDEEKGRIYANIYKLYGQPSRSAKYVDVNNWVMREALAKGLGSREGFAGKQYKDAGVTVFSSNRVYLIIGTQVYFFQRVQENKRKLVKKKPLSDVRVKDIQSIVSQF